MQTFAALFRLLSLDMIFAVIFMAFSSSVNTVYKILIKSICYNWGIWCAISDAKNSKRVQRGHDGTRKNVSITTTFYLLIAAVLGALSALLIMHK